LRAASRARAASTALPMMRLATAGFSSRNAPSLSLTIASTMPLTSVLPSLVLVCPSNCGRGILTLMTAVSPSRMSSPLIARVLQSFAGCSCPRRVDRARQRRAEAGEVRAAFVRVDVVGERVDRLGVAVVPLQRDLDVDAVLLAVHVDRLVVDGRLVLVQVLDERDDAAFVVELVALAVALVVERDRDAAVQERELAQPLRERVEAELGGLEDLRVGLERDLGAALLRRAGDLEIGPAACRARSSAVDLAVAPDLELERSDSALTTETPTPCRPPETL
jgi:hypothetical protein